MNEYEVVICINHVPRLAVWTESRVAARSQEIGPDRSCRPMPSAVHATLSACIAHGVKGCATVEAALHLASRPTWARGSPHQRGTLSWSPASMVCATLRAPLHCQQPMQPLPDALARHRIHHESQSAVPAANGINCQPKTRETEHHRSDLHSDTSDAHHAPDAIGHQEASPGDGQHDSGKPQLPLLPFNQGRHFYPFGRCSCSEWRRSAQWTIAAKTSGSSRLIARKASQPPSGDPSNR